MSDATHAPAPAAPPSMLATVVGGLGMMTIFIGFVMLIVGRGAYTFQGIDSLREVERYKILEDVTTAAKAAQAQPAWVNKDKGIVSLPLEKAIVKAEERLKSRKPTPAGPIAPATPAAAPATPAPAAAAK